MALAVASGSELRAQDAATRLLAFAVDPGCVPAQAFAGVLAQFGTLCLPAPELQPPGRAPLSGRRGPGRAPGHGFAERLAPAPRRGGRRARAAARIPPAGQPGRDRGWPAPWPSAAWATTTCGRTLACHTAQALSQLLREHFPALCERNTGDMKWKKFLYKQLCDRSGGAVPGAVVRGVQRLRLLLWPGGRADAAGAGLTAGEPGRGRIPMAFGPRAGLPLSDTAVGAAPSPRIARATAPASDPRQNSCRLQAEDVDMTVSMFERIGGAATVDRLVEAFYARMDTCRRQKPSAPCTRPISGRSRRS